MADDTIYFYNARGYLQTSRLGAAGGTTAVPMSVLGTLPQGQYDLFVPESGWTSTPTADAGSGGNVVVNAPDREFLINHFRAKNAFTGASVGDLITSIRLMDVSGGSAAQVGATTWRNDTTGADLGGAPSITDLDPVGSNALTDAQLRASAVKVNTAGEVYTSVTVTSVATNAVLGTNPVLFPNLVCLALDIVNDSGVDIQYQRNGAGSWMTILNGSSRFVQGITNANQVGIKRKDGVATTVTIEAEAFNA